MVCRNELGRYLEPFVQHVLEFCDGAVFLDDGSDDGTFEWLIAETDERVHVRTTGIPQFFAHEGRARQVLLRASLAAGFSHLIALDADEFVSDGQTLRSFCEQDNGNGAWAVDIEEVWQADDDALWLRKDGAWGLQSRSPLLYRVPQKLDSRWRIMDRPLACGREPMAVRQLAARAVDTGVAVLHCGWANASERADRYARYVTHDGGKYHRRQHLDSIMWPEARVRLARRDWPEALLPYRDRIVERANRITEAAA